ncbi:hypothetical protein JXR93_06740 [bacterium]|nr:hypothetical protein [bacterium]
MKILLFLTLFMVALMIGCGGSSDSEPVENCPDGCENWEICDTENNKCVADDGKCSVNADCTNEGESCNGTTHVCEVVVTTCIPVCDTWESCNTETTVCELLDGRCNSDTDCSANVETCNTSNHTCETLKTGEDIYNESCINNSCHRTLNLSRFTQSTMASELRRHKNSGWIDLSDADYDLLYDYLMAILQ